MNDFLLFVVLPYLALAIFLLVTVQRYRQRTFTYSSLSSQFLENRWHFWGSVPFHYGIIGVLSLHAAAFLLPGLVLSWNGSLWRIHVLEVAALALAVMTLVGLLNITLRRLAHPKLRAVTTIGDWVVYVLLLVQVVSGILVASLYGWGSSWFATSLAPWLWSLFRLAPDISYVTGMPFLVKAHIVNAFLLIAVFPFTRLVHILVVPNPYLWRKTQVVLWNMPRKRS